MTSNRVVTAWAAGLFEGEGSISITGGRIAVAIQMTDKDVLENLQANFGGSIYGCKKQKEHHKDSWKWVLTSSEKSIEFINVIYEFMGCRRKFRMDEAKQAFLSHRSNRTSNLLNKVEVLRQSGMTHQAIADELNVDRSYVSHMLRGRYKT